jgi:K+/H+ antiporter YhaU regulatory subunit KhtT
LAATSSRRRTGKLLAYVYSRDNEAEARQAKVLTKDEARRIAFNIAGLPELLGTGSRQNQQA